MTYRFIKRRDPGSYGTTYNIGIDMSAFNVKKIVSFTDSNNRDFDFFFFEDYVQFYYIINPKPKLRTISVSIENSDIENNVFPDKIKDFKEAKAYLKSYFENIAFI